MKAKIFSPKTIEAMKFIMKKEITLPFQATHKIKCNGDHQWDTKINNYKTEFSLIKIQLKVCKQQRQQYVKTISEDIQLPNIKIQ